MQGLGKCARREAAVVSSQIVIATRHGAVDTGHLVTVAAANGSSVSIRANEVITTTTNETLQRIRLDGVSPPPGYGCIVVVSLNGILQAAADKSIRRIKEDEIVDPTADGGCLTLT